MQGFLKMWGRATGLLHHLRDRAFEISKLLLATSLAFIRPDEGGGGIRRLRGLRKCKCPSPNELHPYITAVYCRVQEFSIGILCECKPCYAADYYHAAMLPYGTDTP